MFTTIKSAFHVLRRIPYYVELIVSISCVAKTSTQTRPRVHDKHGLSKEGEADTQILSKLFYPQHAAAQDAFIHAQSTFSCELAKTSR